MTMIVVLLSNFNSAKLFNDHILFSPVIFDWLFWKRTLKHVFSSFLAFCCIITPISGIIDHYCIMEN